jgi:hypothetical protein
LREETAIEMKMRIRQQQEAHQMVIVMIVIEVEEIPKIMRAKKHHLELKRGIEDQEINNRKGLDLEIEMIEAMLLQSRDLVTIGVIVEIDIVKIEDEIT